MSCIPHRAALCVALILATLPSVSHGHEPTDPPADWPAYATRIDGALRLRRDLAERLRAGAATARDVQLATLLKVHPGSHAEQAALYYRQPLSVAERHDRAARGIRVEQVWVPAVPGHAAGFHLATVDHAALHRLVDDPLLLRAVSLEGRLSPTLDLARGLIHADALPIQGAGMPFLSGKGVSLAIADSGVDPAHPDLKPPVEAWDLTDGTNPSTWGAEVHNTVTGHGTHVVGIALGDGTASQGRFIGIAPGVDLHFYKIGDDVTSGASEADIVEALQRARDVGARVFSMSYAGVTPFVDGSAPMCQAVDAATAAGTVCFIAAGNSAGAGAHVARAVPGMAASAQFAYRVDAPITLQNIGIFRAVWRDATPGDQNITLVCDNLGPGEQLQELTALAGTSPRGTEGRSWFFVTNLPAGMAKDYQLRFVNSAGDATTAHIYTTFGQGGFTPADAEGTIQAPALADRAIAVGSYTYRTSWTVQLGFQVGTDEVEQAVSSFSSRGPRIDGLAKPDFVAPGSSVIAARDCQWANLITQVIDDDGLPGGAAHYYVQQGTSMACPMAAGAAALLLEAFPGLDPEGVRQALRLTASHAATPDFSAGHGLIDVRAARDFLAAGGYALDLPGNGDDLVLATGVDAPPTAGPLDDVKVASAGQHLLLRLASPLGHFAYEPFVLGARLVPTGTAIVGWPDPHFYLGKPGVILIVDGYTSATPLLLLPGGSDLGFPVPAGLGGWSAVLQGVVVTPKAANGAYALSEGHIIRFE